MVALCEFILGLILTGWKDLGIDLLEHYLDRTADLQVLFGSCYRLLVC
jgi:hypothetical protein